MYNDMPPTYAEVIAGAAKFYWRKYPFPESTLESFLRQAVSDIISILKHPQKINLPQTQFVATTRNTLDKIEELLGRRQAPPTLIKSTNNSTIHQPLESILPIYKKVALSRVKLKDIMQLPRTSKDPDNTCDSIAHIIESLKDVQQVRNPQVTLMCIIFSKGIYDSFYSKIRDCFFQDILPHGTKLTHAVNHIFNDTKEGGPAKFNGQ